MMDKTYILEQGLLERYVLGDLTEQEHDEVEKALESYPELKPHLDRIEANFERLAQENAIAPSEHLKSELMRAIQPKESDVISITAAGKSKNYLWMAASAAAILLIGSIYFYTEWNSTREQLILVQDQYNELNSELEALSRDLDQTNSWYVTINDPNTKKYILEGNALMPDAKLISYVNDIERSVLVNTTYLPELDEAHDYQMWADVEGEMINMGVIDVTTPMLAMNYIDHSESLNITIEPAGGSEHPTVSRLITNIYLK